MATISNTDALTKLQAIKDKALEVQAKLNAGSVASITSPYALPSYEADADKARQNLLRTNQADAGLVVNDKQEYRNALKKYQAQIDATNAVYNDKLNQSRIAGQGRLGGSRAAQARGGLLGSDFGQAQTDTVTGANQEADTAVQNERSVSLNAIYGLARADATASAAAKSAAKKSGAEAVLKYYTEDVPAQKTARLQKVAKALFDKALEPSKLSAGEKAAIAKDWNVSFDDIQSVYNDLKKETDAATAAQDLKTRKSEADIAKINADIASGKLINLGEGNKLYNTETGEVVAYNPKTYAPTGGGGGVYPTGLTTGLIGADGKRLKLTAGQVDTIAGFDGATQAITRALATLNSGVETGPIASLLHSGGKLFDRTDSETLQLEQTLSKLKADYMKALSGAAVSEGEVKRLSRFLPDISDQEGVLKSKLENLTKEIASSRQIFANTLGAVNTNPQQEDSNSVRYAAESAGYDYDQMKLDGLSDQEIQDSL